MTMNMRDETRRRLERTLLIQRLKWAGMALAVGLVMAGVFTFISADHAVEKVRVPATVTKVGPIANKNVQAGLMVDVKLADGRIAEVMVNEITDPKVGQNVEITEHRHATGRKTYSWK